MEIIKIELWGENSLVDGGLRVYWSDEALDFGSVTLYTKDDKSYIDTEYMGREFAEKLILQVLSESEMVG